MFHLSVAVIQLKHWTECVELVAGVKVRDTCHVDRGE